MSGRGTLDDERLRRWRLALGTETDELSDAAKQAILSGNAERFYGLRVPASVGSGHLVA